MQKNLLSLSLTTIIFLTAFGCASKSKEEKYTPPSKANQKLGEWDHDKIRQVRETEQAQTLSEVPPAATDTKNCLVMRKDAMIRAKVTGCTPLDPRAGQGEDSYCCPSKE